MKSKLLIMLKQSVFRNLSLNDFEDSPLMFHAKKDNLLELFEPPGISVSKTKFTGYPDK